jgi:elongation factor G
MEAYLSGEDIPEELLKKAIRRGTVTNRVVPVCCGTSYRNKGVQPLLDAIVDYLPSPLDIPPIEAANKDGSKTIEIKADDSAPFAALAFKIVTDPFVGKLAFCRVYSGTLKAGTMVMNCTKGKRERVTKLLLMHADSRTEVSEVHAGDIAAFVMKDTSTGDTLAAENRQIHLESMEFPEPVIRIAIEPKTKAGQEKLVLALQKLSEEDPTFRYYTDGETGQMIISGMGELHLEIIVDRLIREFKVECRVGKPQVAYRETITKNAESDTKFARQSGGHGQYGHVKIRIEPNPGKGYEFGNSIVGGAIP